MRLNSKVGVCVLGLGVMFLTGCSTTDVKGMVYGGSAVSTGKTQMQAINPSQVKIYYANKDVPKRYKVIGRVSVENYTLLGMTYSQLSIAEAMKKQAASIGANGVIHVSSGLAQTTGDAVITK